MAASAAAASSATSRPDPSTGGAGMEEKAALKHQHRPHENQQQQHQHLAAAAASGRIKYADPRSLPSYPSSGLASNGAAASAAASLGWANRKSADSGKSDAKSSASTTAAFPPASENMAQMRQSSSLGSDGHKAALLAVGSADAALKHASASASAAKPSPNAHESWGSSAATHAFQANRPVSMDFPSTSHGSSAATRAFTIGRSESTSKASPPEPLGDGALVAKDATFTRQRASSNALDGATKAHRASMQARPSAPHSSNPAVVAMTRQMFTSTPPVKPEVDERTSNERLHQTAVDMAKRMYMHQQKMADQTKAAQEAGDDSHQPSPYLNLQDAAYKQAQERLAKLHDEHMKAREYQEYYGNNTNPRPRLSVTAKLRRRSSDSERHSGSLRGREMHEETSIFSNKLSKLEREKRDKDREALLATAQRNVKAHLQNMDEKACDETGRPSPAKMTEWELRAQLAAQSRHDARSDNKGKVDIGGGKFMASEEVNAIAAKRVQPVLNNINEKAEAERERQAVLRMEEQARREEGEKLKAREREAREIQKKLKEEEKEAEKLRKQQEKKEAKAKKEEQKNPKPEEGRHVGAATRDERQEPEQAADPHQEEAGGVADTSPRQNEALGSNPPGRRSPIESEGATETTPRKSELSTSPKSKVKGWIKNRFSRGKSMSEFGDNKRRSFFGGAAMKEQAAEESGEPANKRPSSLRDVAMAGKDDATAPQEAEGPSGGSDMAADLESERDSHGVSPASTPLAEEDEAERDSGKDVGLEPPRPMTDEAHRASRSPTRDSRFREMIEQ